MRISFSNEVVDHILSFLQSDPSTLHRCAASHSLLSNLSERHIYANVILCDFYCVHNSLETSEFIEILNKKPGIVRHVRNLTIHVCVDLIAAKMLCGVASLLPTFSGLNNLEIKADDHYFSWREIHSIFHQPLLDFLHRQGKKKLSICSARYFPLSLLNTCKDVRLTFDRCDNTQYDEEPGAKDASLSYLEPFDHLTIQHCSDECLESIIAWPRIHSLRSLEYKARWCAEEPISLLPRIIAACSNSLTNFCLDFNCYFDSSFHITAGSSITLTGLSHLERLSVRAESIMYPCPESPIPAIVKVVMTALASANLKDVFLEFKFLNFLEINTPAPTGIWLPLVPLAATCSSLLVPVYISENLSSMCSEAVVCEELIPYVEKGVVIMIPTE